MPSITDTTLLSRRRLLAGAAALGGVALLPTGVLAMSESAAVALVNRVVTDIQRIIGSGKGEAAMLAEFETLFRDYAAVEIIAKTALGAPGRQATSRQLAAYIAAFQRYIARKYGRQFKRFEGDRVEITKTRDAGSRGFLITTLNHQPDPGEPPYDVEWWIIEVDGKARFFDLKIEGISMLSTERTEIGTMFESVGRDFDKLVAKLNAT